MDNRVKVAEALEEHILTLMREALTCGVTEESIGAFAQYAMDNRDTILAALRASDTGRSEAEARLAVLAKIVVIQARELQRLSPEGETPTDLDAAMAEFRALQPGGRDHG